MASTCDIYKRGVKLGSGTCSDGSTSITSYTAIAPCVRKAVLVTVTQPGTHAGRTWRTRVVSEGATTVLRDPCPFVGA